MSSGAMCKEAVLVLAPRPGLHSVPIIIGGTTVRHRALNLDDLLAVSAASILPVAVSSIGSATECMHHTTAVGAMVAAVAGHAVAAPPAAHYTHV